MLLNVVLLLLFLLGLVTGFIGTNTGGSVLINVPVMVWLGISPPSAIASSRLASMGTMLGGLRYFHKNKKIDYRLAIFVSFFGIIGALIGAHVLFIVPEIVLKKIMGILILALLGISLFKIKTFSFQPHFRHISLMRKWLGCILFLFVGGIGGFFGCQAKLSTFIFQLVFNKTISESAGTRKVSGLAISIASLLIYGIHGIIDWKFGIALMAGTLIGSSCGAYYGLKKGDAWMQNFFNVVVGVLGVGMIFGFLK